MGTLGAFLNAAQLDNRFRRAINNGAQKAIDYCNLVLNCMSVNC
jgi:hypothetical protein